MTSPQIAYALSKIAKKIEKKYAYNHNKVNVEDQLNYAFFKKCEISMDMFNKISHRISELDYNLQVVLLLKQDDIVKQELTIIVHF